MASLAVTNNAAMDVCAQFFMNVFAVLLGIYS